VNTGYPHRRRLDTLNQSEPLAVEGAGAMAPAMTAELHNTVVERWHRRLTSNPSAKRNHWRTKTIYFRSVHELVTARSGQPLTWRTIVAGARPRGCRSTFYEVAGSHARHRLIDDLIQDGRSCSIQLALRYQRSDAVHQLLDETKIWSYWPYRERLLARLAATPMTPSAAEEALTQSVLAWARDNPPLAEALDFTPPACAVEDLMVIAGGRVTALRVAANLTDLLRRAAETR
jgi:hypothetical protein